MDISELRKLASKEELSLNYIAKDLMISKALFGMQGFENIILKGGTALNRVYLKNKRFSEDIDFDLVFRGSIMGAIEKTREIISRLGEFELSKPRIMKETIRYDLYYNNPLDHRDKIRIEFKAITNPSEHSHKVVNFGFVPFDASLHNVYELEVLLKHKIDCVLNRIEGKDFFDIYHILDVLKGNINIPKQDILDRIDIISKDISFIANTLNHYVPRTKRPDWETFLIELRDKIRKMGE